MNEHQGGTHEWIFEFEKEPNDMIAFMQILDNALKSVNSDYEAKRYKDMTLAFPKYHIVKRGTFYEWLKQHNKLGGQHKVPRLENHRQTLEELLKIHHSL